MLTASTSPLFSDKMCLCVYQICFSLICFAKHDTSHGPHCYTASARVWENQSMWCEKRFIEKRERNFSWNSPQFFLLVLFSFSSVQWTQLAIYARQNAARSIFLDPISFRSLALNCIAHLWCSPFWQTKLSVFFFGTNTFILCVNVYVFSVETLRDSGNSITETKKNVSL